MKKIFMTLSFLTYKLDFNFWLIILISSYVISIFSWNYVETRDILKIHRYYEFILTAIDLVEIEHIFEVNNLDSIQYSKFTIKRTLSPFKWFVDHLHTTILLSKAHRSQTYNWYDYKAAWYNFIFVKPNIHSWFIKYLEECSNSPIVLRMVKSFRRK